jgi:hypothetical protein
MALLSSLILTEKMIRANTMTPSAKAGLNNTITSWNNTIGGLFHLCQLFGKAFKEGDGRLLKGSTSCRETGVRIC